MLGYCCDLILMKEISHSKICENKYLMTSSIDWHLIQFYKFNNTLLKIYFYSQDIRYGTPYILTRITRPSNNSKYIYTFLYLVYSNTSYYSFNVVGKTILYYANYSTLKTMSLIV